MKAHLHSVRIAPKKANLLAKMVRGMPVPEAMMALSLTNKKAARMLEGLLRSAIANASHNDRQDAQTMIIKTVVVNQGQAYRRGMPKARGQMRPYRKFLSHITLTLGYSEEGNRESELGNREKKNKKPKKEPSQEKKNDVKVQQTTKMKEEKSSSRSATSSSHP